MFAKREVRFLGNIVSKNGIKPDPGKTSIIKDMKPPTNVKGLRRALGLMGFYRRFVPHFQIHASPLYHLLKNDVKWNWSEKCESGFNHLKQALVESPILGYPDFTKPFIVYTDASIDGLGAMLVQEQEFESQIIPRAIWYCGRSLNKHEKKYSITDLELTGVYYAIQQFRPYLQYNQVTFYTDHKSLEYLQNCKQPTGRLGRIHQAITMLDYSIKHLPGTKMAHVDAISRFPHLTLPSEYEETIEPDFTVPQLIEPKVETDLSVIAVNAKAHGTKAKLTQEGKAKQLDKFSDLSEDNRTNIKSKQSLDPISSNRIKLMNGDDVDVSPSELKILLATIDDFILEDGILYRVHYQPRSQERCKANKCSLQLVVPKSLQQHVIKELHSDVHFAHQKVWHKAKEKYWWPRMFCDIKEFCTSCIQCQEAKGHQKRPPLIPIESEHPWQIVGVDITEPHVVSKNGNKYILVFVDLFSKYIVAKAIPNMTAETVANVFFQEIICRYGAPQKLLSDRGSQFLSSVMQFTRSLFSVQGIFTAAWNPRCDGMTERSNQTITKCLSFLVNSDHDNWDEKLAPAVFAYNTCPSFRSTDYTPYFILFGRHCKGPADLQLVIPSNTPKSIQHYVTNFVDIMDEVINVARENIAQHQAKQKEYFDKNAHLTQLQEGDKVFLHVAVTPKHLSRKLRHPWCRGYAIHRFIGPNTAKIRKLGDGKIVKSPINVKRLKKCIDPKVFPDDVPASDLLPPLDDIAQEEIPVHNFEPLMAAPNVNTDQNDGSSDVPDGSENNENKKLHKIEKIINVRKVRGQLQYRVRWEGYGSNHDSWVREEDVNDAFREFIKNDPPQQKRRKRRGVYIIRIY